MVVLTPAPLPRFAFASRPHGATKPQVFPGQAVYGTGCASGIPVGFEAAFTAYFYVNPTTCFAPTR